MEVLVLERTLTELDHVRLLNLVRREGGGAGRPNAPRAPSAIADVLDGCAVVPSRQVSPDVVTMYSQLLLHDGQTGQRHTLTLCYPADAEPAAGFVSVLSPVGAALLGLTVGNTARWTTPSGVESTAEILAIHFQPEASGDHEI